MKKDELIKNFGRRVGMDIDPSPDGIYSFEVDGLVFTIHDLDECDRIVFVGDMGAPAPGDKEALYRSILEAQYMFSSTAGATFSINPETGNFVLCKSLVPAVFDDDTFFAEAESFLNTLHVWADIIRDYRAGASEQENVSVPFGVSGFIAV